MKSFKDKFIILFRVVFCNPNLLEVLNDCCSYSIPPTPGKGVYKPENFVKFFPKVYPLTPVIIFVKMGF